MHSSARKFANPQRKVVYEKGYHYLLICPQQDYRFEFTHEYTRASNSAAASMRVKVATALLMDRH